MHDFIQEEQEIIQNRSHKLIQTKPSKSSFSTAELKESSFKRQEESKATSYK
jgi:hypothetical protein